jgi:glutamate-1-semialdehyde 2,1-aminomutase
MSLAIIQARLGSQRFPRKVLHKLWNGKRIIDHIIDVVKESDVDEVVVTTPDKELADSITSCPVSLWEGERDVLAEYNQAMGDYNGIVVRITGDCPMLYPETINKVLEGYKTASCNYATGGDDGFDVEVTSSFCIAYANTKATDSYDREHVTPYIKRHGDCIVVETDNPRGTSVDTIEDLHLVNMLMADKDS